MEEYIARVGQQAAVIYCTPGKSQHQPHYYKVVGSQPLQNIVSVYSRVSSLETKLFDAAGCPVLTLVVFLFRSVYGTVRIQVC